MFTLSNLDTVFHSLSGGYMCECRETGDSWKTLVEEIQGKERLLSQNGSYKLENSEREDNLKRRGSLGVLALHLQGTLQQKKGDQEACLIYSAGFF